MPFQTSGKTILVKLLTGCNSHGVLCYIPPYIDGGDKVHTAKEQLEKWAEGKDFLNAYMNYYDHDNTLNGKRVIGYELGPKSSYEIINVLNDLIIDDLPEDEL